MNKEMKHDNMLDTEIRILGQDSAPVELASATTSTESAPAEPPFAESPAASASVNQRLESVAGRPIAPATAPKPASTPHHRSWLRLAVVALTAGAIAAGVAWWVSHNKKSIINIYNQKVVAADVAADSTSVATIAEGELDGPAFVMTAATSVNDIPLNVYTPHGGRLSLYMGQNPDTIPGLICAVQAADVRADVDMPVGAFVQNGTLISRGNSKPGFCAVIDNSIALGRDAETPLLERAISQKGFFFRQFSLISGGEVTDEGPKGKSTRRALCLIDGAVSIVECTSRESYHDFAQALADYGATEAIATVGGNALIVWRDKADAPLQVRGKREDLIYKSCNFLVWTE